MRQDISTDETEYDRFIARARAAEVGTSVQEWAAKESALEQAAAEAKGREGALTALADAGRRIGDAGTAGTVERTLRAGPAPRHSGPMPAAAAPSEAPPARGMSFSGEPTADTPPEGAVSRALSAGGGSALPQDELVRRLAAVEKAFPQGLKSRRYSMDEMIAPIGPGRGFASEGTRQQTIVNPLNGQTIDLAPGMDPRLYLAGINMLAEAKARAMADVMRGLGAEQASRSRLAELVGMDPSQVAGMTEADANQAINIGGADVRRKQARDEEMTRERGESDQMLEGLRAVNPDLAEALPKGAPPSILGQLFNQNQEERRYQDTLTRNADAEKKDRESRSGLAGAMADLQEMPPEEAARVAEQRLVQHVDVGQARLYAQQFRERALYIAEEQQQREQATAKQLADDDKRLAAEAKEERTNIRRDIIAPLQEALEADVMMSEDEVEDVGGMSRKTGRKTRVRDEAGTVALMAGKIRRVVAELRAKGVDLDQLPLSDDSKSELASLTDVDLMRVLAGELLQFVSGAGADR